MPTATGNDTGVSPSSFNEYDFVVIGGGLCGLVLATRLSENPNVTVGVLESGPWKSDDPKMDIPYRMTEMVFNPEYQAVTLTVPQPHIGGRQLPCARGRVLGGGSSVNFMGWLRASKKEYDSFEALGNPGWNFESLTRAGRKSETFHPPNTPDQLAVAFTDPNFHGNNGPIQTSFSGWIPESHKAFNEVLEKSFGLPKNDQGYNGLITGIRSIASSLDPTTGKRSSSATAYFAPNASRPNLSVLLNAHATKVELEEINGIQNATGVHYLAGGQSHFVRARKEVIICCGTLDSPQMLERSGIGNPTILQPLGIDVKVDNVNVGENLQDHVMTWMNYLTKPGHHTQDALEIPEFAHEAAVTYATFSETQYHGPLAGTISGLAYVPPEQIIPKHDLEEMKRKLYEETKPFAANEGIKFLLDNLDDPGRGAIEWLYIGRRMPSPAPAEPGRSYIGLVAALQHPFSRGNIHVVSADPEVDPAIDPHYLESSWDKELLIRGLEYIDKASRAEPLASFIDRRTDPAPGDNSRSVFAKYLEETGKAGVHWIGTTSMLPREKGGVVNPRCTVYGTSNLRVVDASIIPLHFSAHPQATLYAMAELAAELIIDDHKGAQMSGTAL